MISFTYFFAGGFHDCYSWWLSRESTEQHAEGGDKKSGIIAEIYLMCLNGIIYVYIHYGHPSEWHWMALRSADRSRTRLETELPVVHIQCGPHYYCIYGGAFVSSAIIANSASPNQCWFISDWLCIWDYSLSMTIMIVGTTKRWRTKEDLGNDRNALRTAWVWHCAFVVISGFRRILKEEIVA